MVTSTRPLHGPYLALRKAWGEYTRVRFEAARLKILLRQQLFGLFPATSVKVVYERLRSIRSPDARLAMSWDGTSSRFSSSMTVFGVSLASEPALM